MSVLNEILKHKIVAIIRGANPADVLKISQALYDGGVRILEITMNSVQPLDVIEQLTDKLGDKMVIGAGTVIDVAMAKDAISAGAKFILSPVVDIEVIKFVKNGGIVVIPGAYTPTEILCAFKNGGDIIKVFPAVSPGYLKDIAGPLPQIPLLPTGGINLENIKKYQQAGAVGFGIGSSLVNVKKEITDQYLGEISTAANRLVQAIVEF
ncbi:MAG TPA: bifunctional 4-hydroxy-2-oxoglutarate aldolase/2-dehydro-3-deoxy-phosphogluconate aldolase [Mucilaginibacter sp.]|jgi:2-dehydro-3-deoxyphosphogluconate aldolase/(4S)-4-hydroxy-2-oxoglutarate aldolase